MICPICDNNINDECNNCNLFYFTKHNEKNLYSIGTIFGYDNLFLYWVNGFITIRDDKLKVLVGLTFSEENIVKLLKT